VRPADVASADAARDLGTLMAAARRLLESELSAHTQAQLPVVVNSYEPDLANLKRRTCWALQLAAPGRGLQDGAGSGDHGAISPNICTLWYP
jgi:hypothetical protein